MWAPGRNAPLIWFLMSALYFFACLYRTLPHLFFSLHFFLTYLLSYLSFPLRTDPISFQAGCRKRLLNLAFNFFVFILCCRLVLHFFWLVNAWFCCVKFSFSIPSQEIGLEKRPRNDLFCVEWVIKPQLNQSTYGCGLVLVWQRCATLCISGTDTTAASGITASSCVG